MYRWVECSKDSLAISSLSILGDGHPFIPLNSPLRGVFERDIGCRCRIIAGQMDTSQAFPPQNLNDDMAVRDLRCIFTGWPLPRLCSFGWNRAYLGCGNRRVPSRTQRTHWPGVFSSIFPRWSSSRFWLGQRHGGCVGCSDGSAPSATQRAHHMGGRLLHFPRMVAISPLAQGIAQCVCGIQRQECALKNSGMTMSCESVAFSPDGHYLASASASTSLHLTE